MLFVPRQKSASRPFGWQSHFDGGASFLIALLAVLLPAGLAACAEYREVAAPAHPDLIIVRQFATPGRVVALDPSLGFSLHRGEPGVPRARRAASVARAAAFMLADTVTQQLRELGYDAVRSDEAGPEPGGRALVVSGAFRSINEGHRRRFAAKDASVAARRAAAAADGVPARFAANPAPVTAGAARAWCQFGGGAFGHHDRPCCCRVGSPQQLAGGAALIFRHAPGHAGSVPRAAKGSKGGLGSA